MKKLNPINIVVPDGSMQDVVINLLDKAGLQVKLSKRTKEGKINVDWINKFFFQRPQEIPIYLNAGNFDLAIVGEDWIANWGYKFPVLLKLPGGRAGSKLVKIVLAAPKDIGISRVEELPLNCKISSEYVQLTQKYLAKKGRQDICVLPSYGNTEQKILFGSTAIVDITESGESLKENNLSIIDVVMESKVVLVANITAFQDESKKVYVDCFSRLIKGALEASSRVLLTVNVPEKVLNKAVSIIGGLKSPSCSPLMKEKWFALQSVIPKDEEQKIIFDLLQIGVTDIIVNREVPLIMS